MKWISFFAALTVVTFLYSNGQAQVTKALTSNASVHDAALDGTIVNGTDYYGRGNDDTFAIDGEYGIATFNYTPADFGVASLASGSLTQFDYTLTHQDQAFSDGVEFILWLTTDDFDANYTGLSYNTSLIAGLNTSEYANLSMLGFFPYVAPPASAGGDQEVLSIPLTGAAWEDQIVAEINASSDFSIIITAAEDADDVTFTGFDDVLEPGGKPLLTINSTSSAVPEPTALGFLAIAGLAGLTRRRWSI